MALSAGRSLGALGEFCLAANLFRSASAKCTHTMAKVAVIDRSLPWPSLPQAGADSMRAASAKPSISPRAFHCPAVLLSRHLITPICEREGHCGARSATVCHATLEAHPTDGCYYLLLMVEPRAIDGSLCFERGYPISRLN